MEFYQTTNEATIVKVGITAHPKAIYALHREGLQSKPKTVSTSSLSPHEVG